MDLILRNGGYGAGDPLPGEPWPGPPNGADSSQRQLPGCRVTYRGRGSSMATLAPEAPWAMRLVTDRLPVGPATYANVVLDASTQTARYTNTAGQVVEMGQHGTSRTTGTASVSGGGDGQNPQPQTQDDHTTDYESD